MRLCIASEHWTTSIQVTVDHTENDGNATVPDVNLRDCCALTAAHELSVVQPACERLNEQHRKHDNAKDWVCFAHIFASDAIPNTESERRDKQQPGEDLSGNVGLQDTVNPPTRMTIDPRGKKTRNAREARTPWANNMLRRVVRLPRELLFAVAGPLETTASEAVKGFKLAPPTALE